MESKMEEIREWAKAKIASGVEPPWSWYQYMKLIETIDAILGGQRTTITMENSQQSDLPQGGHLQLVDSTYRQDTVQPHLSGLPVHLPM